MFPQSTDLHGMKMNMSNERVMFNVLVDCTYRLVSVSQHYQRNSSSSWLLNTASGNAVSCALLLCGIWTAVQMRRCIEEVTAHIEGE